MALHGSDEPPSIQEDEASRSSGSQMILLGAIVLVLFGLIIALNPNRRE
jgi:hypothetical protein